MQQESWPFPRLRLAHAIALGILLLLVCLFPFWGTIVTAAIFAFGLRPSLDRVRARFRLSRKFTTAIAVAALFFLLMK